MTGTIPCTYGAYAHNVSASDYSDDVMGNTADAASKNGAVLIMLLHPFIPLNQVDASEVKVLTIVWLRFAHEMNRYISTTGDIGYKGTTTESNNRI